MIRLATFLSAGDVRPRLGAVDGEAILDLTAAHGRDWDMLRALALPIGELRDLIAAATVRLPRAACHVLPPVPAPGKIFCVGKNSKVHRAELAAKGMLLEDPKEPTSFVKLTETLVGDGARVVRPEGIPPSTTNPNSPSSSPGAPSRCRVRRHGITSAPSPC